MSLRSFFFASPAIALMLVAGAASAQEPAAPAQEPAAAPSALSAPSAPSDNFGQSGQFALSLNHGFSVNQTDLLGGSTEIQGTIFVAPRLSIGLALGAQYLSHSSPSGGDSTHNFIFHVGPRIGYDIRLGDKVSIWPQAGIDYRHYEESSTSSSSSGTTVSGTDSTSNFGLTIMAPIVLHPTNGFFVGAGPAFYTDLTSSASRGELSADQSKLTSIGLVATLGGSF